ncbi:HAD family hydrolase [Pseudonocardia xinjiangensis]|uniref:HAD family phosphatase n=1 Tax=Pseudonocardia xinjiangensis TaxID=75289 RepID=A0ABX1RCG8_9PSEU|nr:HAD family hydrolase [Pseudonocardia xinjiangensis]NMH77496.1 HAD family phosphatase [Pseudonocardia xinjiangensis]
MLAGLADLAKETAAKAEETPIAECTRSRIPSGDLGSLGGVLLPRLIATDLDGTLLRPDGAVSDRTLAALRAITELGATVVFVTARPPRQLDKLAERLRLSGPAVCSNGAIVYTLSSHVFAEVHALEVKTVREVVKALAGTLPDVRFAVDTGRMAYDGPGYDWPSPDDRKGARVRIDDAEQLWGVGDPIVKLLAWSPRLDTYSMLSIAAEAVQQVAEITCSSAVGPLEVSAPGVTKASTVAGLCGSLGVNRSEVIAFGDMPNDLSLLRWAGAGYAMANAHPSVLSAVPLHT